MPRSESTSNRAERFRKNVRDHGPCPTCRASQGDYCMNDDGGRRLANHKARVEKLTGTDLDKVAWGNQRSQRYHASRRQPERRRVKTPGGWGS